MRSNDFVMKPGKWQEESLPDLLLISPQRLQTTLSMTFGIATMTWIALLLLINHTHAWSLSYPMLRLSSKGRLCASPLTVRLYNSGSGHIYEYIGERNDGQPPEAIAKLLGFKAKKLIPKAPTKRKKRTGPTEKQVRIARREAYKVSEPSLSIRELERSMHEQFGFTNALKKMDAHEMDKDEEADDEGEKVRKSSTLSSRVLRSQSNQGPLVDPFEAALQRLEPPTPRTAMKLKPQDEKVDLAPKRTPPVLEPKKAPRYKDWDVEFDTDIDEVEPVSRSGPMNALAGFRLRPPPPPDPTKVALEATKEQHRIEKERKLEERRVELRKLHKKLFKPFRFTDIDDNGDHYDDLQEDGLDLFTNSTFEALGVTNPTVLQNLAYWQMQSPTQIQAAAIPALHRGQNVVLQAQTGSGKTLAYLLPLLKVVDPSVKQVQAIILAPSRELVQQIGQVAASLFEGTDYRVQSLIGGANIHHQTIRLRDDRPQILIATPGRLAEIVFKLEKLRLGRVKVVVVDEVDSMMQEPYIGEVETLLQATPLYSKAAAAERNSASNLTAMSTESVAVAVPSEEPLQRLLWLASATSHDPAVGAFADRFTARSGKGWSEISVTDGAALPSSITHGLISISRERSLEYLQRLLHAKPAIRSALIFVNDPHRVEVICKDLLRSGIIAAPLHGDANKDDRKEIVARIKDGRLKLVVTTELAARGIDIPELSHVINFELPTDAPHYVHRTGRCGRAGRQGLVINFANPDTKFVIRRFGKKLGVVIHDCEIRDGRVYLKHEE